MDRPIRRVLLFVLLFVCGSAAAATCPFNIPVVTIPPQQVAGFNWSSVIRPMGDACVQAIEVDPTNEQAWYVGSATALYMTKDNGATWKKPVLGNVFALLIVPAQPNLVYAGADNKLWLSRDSGGTWTMIHQYPKPIRSILVFSGTLVV